MRSYLGKIVPGFIKKKLVWRNFGHKNLRKKFSETIHKNQAEQAVFLLACADDKLMENLSKLFDTKKIFENGKLFLILFLDTNILL